MLRSSFVLSALTALSVLACSTTTYADGATSPATTEFRWQKALPRPARLEVSNINGGIRAEAASGDVVEIVAVKSGRTEDFPRVNVKVTETDGVIRACALWPGQSTCEDKAPSRDPSEDRIDVRVDFVIRAPAAIHGLGLRTMNGPIVASTPSAAATAHTMNGRIDVTARGPVDAKTMNGDIAARVKDKAASVRLTTMNGRIDLALPGDADADVEASTMRGDVSSAFGRVVAPELPGVPHVARFKLGGGGAAVHLQTMNGNIQIQRGT